jgi:SAM-dependent methyltransferase
VAVWSANKKLTMSSNDFWIARDSSATDKIHEPGGAPGEARPFAASKRTTMSEDVIRSIRRSYDQLADEYARRIFDELNYKPLDRKLLDRFAAEVSGHGEVCDMGCGPGHVARYLRDAGTTVFGLDLSPKMLEQARQLGPDMQFREGNMMALDLQDGTLAGITAFYAIVNIPKESLPSVTEKSLARIGCWKSPGRTTISPCHCLRGNLLKERDGSLTWNRRTTSP